MTLHYLLFGLLFGYFLQDVITRAYTALHDKYYWKRAKLQNFPFNYKGKTLWFSRSVAVASFIFAKNENNEWCVLANKRGAGTPDFQGYWNAPCGYLDFDETAMQAASREVFEETGVSVTLDQSDITYVNTDPHSSKQNVTIRFMKSLCEQCDTIPLSTSHMEEDEVESIAWIPISKVDEYNWAFDHGNIIKSMSDKL